MYTSLEVVACCLDYLVFSSVDVSGFSLGTNNAGLLFSFCFLFSLARMLLDQQLCPAVAGRKCGAFMSPLFRDPHPTCARCRGKKCTPHVTCDICKDWSVAQWEAFLKKRSYSGCCKSRPSHCTATLPSLRLCFFGSWALFAFSTSFLPSFRRVWACGEVGGHLPGWLSWCFLSSLSLALRCVWVWVCVCGGGGGESVSEVLGFWRRV